MTVPSVPKPFPQQMQRGQSSVPNVPALYRAGTEGTVTQANDKSADMITERNRFIASDLVPMPGFVGWGGFGGRGYPLALTGRGVAA